MTSVFNRPKSPNNNYYRNNNNDRYVILLRGSNGGPLSDGVDKDNIYCKI